jgi:hypothetical protein
LISNLWNLAYPPPLIPDNNGLNANQSKKSEINATVDLAGLSVPLKQCQTESVSTPTKLTKPESQLKT